MYTLNNIVSKSTKQEVTELKEEINPQSRLEIFNSPVSVTKKTSRQTNKHPNDDIDVNAAMNKLHLLDIHRTLQNTSAEHTFFSSIAGTVTKITK